MKDYKDVARSVFRRRDEYLKEKKRKREVFMKRSAVALSCCLMMLVGFNIWRTDSLKTIAPSPDKSQFNVTEANTTAPPTTDENGNTGIPVTTTVTAATAPNGNTAVQNRTTTTASSDDTAPAVTTTRTKGGSSAVDAPLPTTYSFMEVTAVRRTTAATTATGRTTTTTQRKGAESSKTTASTTSAAPRTVRTTTLTTVKPDIRTSRTTTAAYTTTGYHTSTTLYYTSSAVYSTTITSATSAVYSTTRFYTTSTAVYSTTRSYTTTTIAGTFIPDTTTRDITPSPVATDTTTAMTTTTVAYTHTTTTTLTGFRYNGKYYKTTGIRVNKDQLDEYLGSEFDENTGNLFYIYRYGSLDTDFMCAAVIYGQDSGYVGVNETWQPETLGELLDGANAHGTMLLPSLSDSSDKHIYVFNDAKTAIDLITAYRGKELQIEGLSIGAQNYLAEKEGTEPPGLDLNSKRGTIQVLTSGLADDGHYLHYGFIHITNDGKLEIDLFYLKYTADIGRNNAEELIKRLKSL